MIRRIHLIALFIVWMTQGLTAQNINQQFKDCSLSDALLAIDDACDSITVNFVYDDLEDFRVTAEVSNASILEAVRQVCGFYPMRIITFGNDIFVECTQRDSLRFIGRVIDKQGRPMRYANVALLSPVDSTLVNHGVANDDGYVVIPCPMQEVILRVTHVGYQTYERRCKISDVDEIILLTDTKQLKGVKVSAQLSPSSVTRRSYASLWKEANRLAKNDMPRKEMEVMRLIAMKARAEENDGQLLAAEMMYGSLQRVVSLDSLDSFISRLVAEEQSAATHSPMLAATYQTILSKIMADNDLGSEDAEMYRQKALSNPEALTRSDSRILQPFLNLGDDSDIFGHDMLSVIGMETGNDKMLHDYYTITGNRKAQMVLAMRMLNDDYHTSNGQVMINRRTQYLASLDSLIQLYSDLPECCELAIERYKVMCDIPDCTTEQQIAFLDGAISKWGNWRNVAQLRNFKLRLTQPQVKIGAVAIQIQPRCTRMVKLEDIRNIHQVNVKIMRLDIDQEHPQLTSSPYLLNRLEKYTNQKTEINCCKQLAPHPEYEIFEDSIALPSLNPGIYLLKWSTDRKDANTITDILHVSDITLLSEALPDDKIRYAVVSTTTGKPIPHARLSFFIDKLKKQTVRTDRHGEAVCKNEYSNKYAYNIFASTDDDHFSLPLNWPSRHRTVEMSKEKRIHIFTDRKIYRPGQQVQASIAVVLNDQNHHQEMLQGEQLHVSLQAPGSSVMAVDTVITTDEFGTATLSFSLHKSKCGTYSIIVAPETNQTDYSAKTFCFFNVEEYKLPTFDLQFQPLTRNQQVADTLKLPLQVRSFSGGSVSRARVEYKASIFSSSNTSSSFFEGLSMSRDALIATIADDTTYTAANGMVNLSIPLKIPNIERNGKKVEYFTIRVNAKVTDMAGETHETSTIIKYTTHPRTLSLRLSSSIMKVEKPIWMKWQLKDQLGIDMDDEITYYIDNLSNVFRAKANERVEMPECQALTQVGTHCIYAICNGDTVSQTFQVHDFSAKRLGTHMPSFLAVSDGRFPTDGSAVKLQFGTSLHDVHLVYSIIANEQVVEQGTLQLNDEIHTRSLTYRPEYGPSVFVASAFIKDGRIYKEQAIISMPLPDKRLKMKWTTFRNRLTPGQDEEWRLQVTHPDGSPAAANVLATLYDASLDRISMHSLWFNPFNQYRVPGTAWSTPKITDYNTHTLISEKLRFDAAQPLSFSSFDPLLTRLRGNNETIQEKLNISRLLPKKNNKKGRPGYACGIVVDEVGDPLVGAIVTIKDKNSGGITNIDGEFEIAMLEPQNLSVSYIGCKSATVKAYPGSYLNIVLYPSTVLNEVVVKTRVRGSGLLNEPDVDQALQGRIAGLDLGQQQPGSPERLEPVTVRENFNETAFFMPTLHTEKDGTATMAFTLPESVTTWHLLTLAYDREANYAQHDTTVVAQKEVMVQPNMPRFVRSGDQSVIAAAITCLSQQNHSGMALLQLLDPATETVVWSSSQPFTVEGGSSTVVDFHYQPTDQYPLLICKMSVSGDSFSDGEQHYLPVLPDREPVLTTHPITMHGASRLDIPLSHIILKEPSRVTIEMTDNPAWLIVGAIPTLATRPDDDALSQASALYVNMVAGKMMNSQPRLREVMEQWRDEVDSKEGQESALARNQELRNVLLEETPWVTEATNESAQKRQLMKYFDMPTLNMRTNSAIEQLKALQCADGGWPWCKGMDSSPYITTTVMEILTRLASLTQENHGVSQLIEHGMAYLDKLAAKKVKEMKQQEAENKKRGKREQITVKPDEQMLHYLYIASLQDKDNKESMRAARKYLLSFIRDHKLDFSIYGKAASAVVLAREGQKTKAREYLQSVLDYAVTTDEMGMYFDTPKAHYSWRNYRIPTVVMMMEAVSLISPEDTTSIRMMQRWLLQEKRTQLWNTSINSIDAIHAFLRAGNTGLDKSQEATAFRLDGKPLDMPLPTAPMGYVKTTLPECHAQTLTVEKSSDGTSWGAVYIQTEEKSEKVADASSGFYVKREVVSEGDQMSVGDKIKVRITIRADRDYDFVQVVDKRASCLEPVRQLSEYHWNYQTNSKNFLSYYCQKKDCSTLYFIQHMSKGVHVLETEYYIDREGTYGMGTCTVQCAYAPEFTARTRGSVVRVGVRQK